MTPLATVVVFVLMTASVAARASAEVPQDPAALAEAYFDESERFDAFVTYESRRGPARMLFTLARRWHDGLAELLFDVREPTAFRKVALLARQNRGGSDDVFAYMGDLTDRRVVRLTAQALERQAVFSLFALGDFRPFAPGELLYEGGMQDAIVAGTPCRVVIARPAVDALGFDRVELAFAADTGLLLESRFFRGEREFRRISISPDAYAENDGRRLPMLRTAHSWADAGETELVTKRVLATAELPDELFSHRNLVAQHFPDF